jgi:small subunit ribosomal protein S20
MSKKQRNRKLILQNKRNRTINRRYSSTIKSLAKLFKLKLSNYKKEESIDVKLISKTEILTILQNYSSILDKAVKKNVIHKNNAARKKSNFGILSNKL